jgi:hypothetical protein
MPSGAVGAGAGVLVAVFFVARFLGDFRAAPFFFGDFLAVDFLAAFFLVDFLAGDFFAAFFFAMSDGSFRCSAQFIYTVIPQGRWQPGRDIVTRMINSAAGETSGQAAIVFQPRIFKCLAATSCDWKSRLSAACNLNCAH